MKAENKFAVVGFVGSDAQIRQFTNASVARFPLAVSRQEKNGEETRHVSAFLNVEVWRKNGNAESLNIITRGARLLCRGYFKPDEWTDKDGVKHNRVVLVATELLTPEKEETDSKEG